MRWLRLMVAGVLLPWGAACGYGFPGRADHIPAHAGSISVRHFRNRTDRMGVEVALRSALEDVIRERGVLRVSGGRDGDLTLAGEIRSFRFTRPVASSSVDRAVIYATSIVVDARLGRSDGTIVWRGTGLVETTDAAVAPGVVIPSSPRFQQGTLNARDVSELTDIQLAEYRLSGEVLRELVDAMARTIYSQMMEGF
jgi:hypothetical protein